jgi:dipeptidase
VPKHKLSVTDMFEVLRHDKDSKIDCAPADAHLVCALCSGATQTSFAAQLRRGVPLEIGIVYWVCLASPRTSFYVPFHFGIADFPAGWRFHSERPTAEVYRTRVRAPFVADSQQAFWTFSSFRDKVENAGPAAVMKAKAEAQRLERDSVSLQKPLEETACRLYRTDRVTAMRLLENYSQGTYLSAVAAMSAVPSGN